MDINSINILTAFLLIFFGYLVGSIPNAIWIGKVFFHKDVRDFGSGNAGGTNAGRVFGKRIGVLVIFLDALKVIIPLYISWIILTKVNLYDGRPLVSDVTSKYVYGINDTAIKFPIYWLTTIGCCIGHCFPLFAQFKGGKNVSCFYGIAIGTSWLFGVIPGLLFMLILKLKKYVSLSSILSSWIAVLFAIVWAIFVETKVVTGSTVSIVTYGATFECNWLFAVCLTFAAGLLTFTHRTNISRLKNHSERKITWMK